MRRAEAGDAAAQTDFGYLYFSGAGGMPKDYAKALFWFRKSADQNFARGFDCIGSFYEMGLGGLPKDPVKALASAVSEGSHDGQSVGRV